MCLLIMILVLDNQQDRSSSPNVAGDLLTLVVMSVHEDPLNQVVTILITRNYYALVIWSKNTRKHTYYQSEGCEDGQDEQW